MARWMDEPWATNPEFLLESLDKFYRKAMAAGKCESPSQTTMKKVLENRKWCASVSRVKLLAAIQDMEVIWIPASVEPGPGFLFPIRDTSGEVRRAHIRMVDEKKFNCKYLSLVNKDRFTGPAWLGDSDEKLEGIIHAGQVVVMEGPFDLLAIRAVAAIPDLCPLTKRLSDLHWEYLRILGVKKIRPIFDNEVSGVGEKAAERMAEFSNGIVVEPLLCPGKDPAECLKDPTRLRLLCAALESSNPNPDPVSFDEDDY